MLANGQLTVREIMEVELWRLRFQTITGSRLTPTQKRHWRRLQAGLRKLARESEKEVHDVSSKDRAVS